MNDEIIRILLVEDDPCDARVVSQWLADLPAEAGATPLFQVAHVRRLADSLAWLQAQPVDLMLLDLGLPDSQGLKTLAQVRERAPHTPVLVLTGEDDERLAGPALEMGAREFLVKGRYESPWRAIRFIIELMQSAAARRPRAAHRAPVGDIDLPEFSNWAEEAGAAITGSFQKRSVPFSE